jgi:HD superfamily phosphohydrolase YqeK
MYTCASLAMRYSYPMQDALYAGLLHDCAKYMGADELIKAAEKHDDYKWPLKSRISQNFGGHSFSGPVVPTIH